MISPQKRFTIFNNSTAFAQLARDDTDKRSLPCLLEDMLYSDYEMHAKGRAPPKYYHREHYYFQGQLLGKSYLRTLQLPVLQCHGELSAFLMLHIYALRLHWGEAMSDREGS